MIIVAPLTVIGPADLTALAPPRRLAPATVTVLTTMIAMAVLDAVLALAFHLHAPGDTLWRALALVSASARLYLEPGLFAPSQLVTCTLIHDWPTSHAVPIVLAALGLAADLAVLLVVGRALERTIGSVAMALLIAVLAPLSAAVHLYLPAVVSPVVAAPGLITALAGAACGLLPERRCRCVIAYWVVVGAGWLPFTVTLPVLAASYVGLAILHRLALGGATAGLEALIVLAASATMGWVAGVALRYATRR